ncbi:WD40-repeat-containing domain protein [Lentinula raphanica]|uniref:WD40-repeat-containing domain protein n=1 Tax=Lentinula raphanica TaxID=153919 RepID=A0AA38P462_9AGAR|nr:WD40-repeat-containing domain protein [Lentinula raphanica]
MINLFRSKALYKKLTSLKGPQDAITALAFSIHGKFLAAVGPGGANIWNLSDHQSVPLTSLHGCTTGAPGATEPPEMKGFPALAWLYFSQRSRHVLLLGTVGGQLQIWDYIDERLIVNITLAPGIVGQKQALSVDVYPREVPVGTHAQIVVSYTSRSVLVGHLRADGDFKQRVLITLEDGFMPKTVRFDKSGNVIVFSMHGGIIVSLDSLTGNILWRKSDAPRFMATVSLDEDCQSFVACTDQGFELWDFDRMILTKEFEQAPISLSLPKHACFSEWKTKVIGGTDRACAEVYDARNGKFEQRLAYPQGGLVQAVAAYTTNDRFLIAVAGANGRRACDVILWYKKHVPRTDPRPGSSDEYYTFRIKKWYIRLVFYILCALWVVVAQTLIILNNSEVRTNSPGLNSHSQWYR